MKVLFFLLLMDLAELLLQFVAICSQTKASRWWMRSRALNQSLLIQIILICPSSDLSRFYEAASYAVRLDYGGWLPMKLQSLGGEPFWKACCKFSVVTTALSRLCLSRKVNLSFLDPHPASALKRKLIALWEAAGAPRAFNIASASPSTKSKPNMQNNTNNTVWTQKLCYIPHPPEG